MKVSLPATVVPAERRTLRLTYWFYRWLWSSIDWLYPPNCGGCGKRGSRWCPVCDGAVAVVKPPLCLKCGRPQGTGEMCSLCKGVLPRYTALRSWAIFSGPIRHALHELKYKRNVSLGEIFSRHLIEVVSQSTWGVNMVIPVPLGIARLAERGYNQASLLARPVSMGMGIPYCPQGLSRVRETRSQVDLSASERKDNVAGAFQARPNLVEGHSVLLIDDITTTGATLDECASALLAGGAESVYALTLARTPMKSPGVS